VVNLKGEAFFMRVFQALLCCYDKRQCDQCEAGLRHKAMYDEAAIMVRYTLPGG
jgi:hypothetical protein